MQLVRQSVSAEAPKWSAHAEERFEVSGDELERHLSLSLEEPEQLRRAVPSAAQGPLFGPGDSTPGDYEHDQERLEPPPDDVIDAMQAPPSRPPSEQVCPSLCPSQIKASRAICIDFIGLSLGIWAAWWEAA